MIESSNKNFKFRQCIEESWLSFAEKYDIWNIFNCLSDERKIQIIDNWPHYLDQILKIRSETDDKRKENIRNALNNINNIVNEAILRQKESEAKKEKLEKENREIQRNAQIYDQMKKANDLQSLINKTHE
ncbi:MAG: hypothetical protein ACD_4C00137G0005 [uncultured bacterium (gcode 4)]|uniref:Uncharacterized protein n=1 Tax=uncultured bacterium (gcode 4) TaxID=1234023 RepID=K2G9J7_9BACT|nr:MAG: hypothetical protein ACD_4C00137G0005 [uncultured bacterium (gcode 4)]